MLCCATLNVLYSLQCRVTTTNKECIIMFTLQQNLCERAKMLMLHVHCLHFFLLEVTFMS
jgi:hypothetical protein